MKRYALPLALGLLLVQGFICSSERLRSPHWNRDTCASCRMVIGDPSTAAQVLPLKGRAAFFDDLGCAFRAVTENQELYQAKIYMLSPETREEWVEVTRLRFSDGANTPMGHGFVPTTNGPLSYRDVERRLRASLGETVDRAEGGSRGRRGGEAR